MNIIEKINEIPNLQNLNGCTTKQIKEASKSLGISFPDEYIDYVKAFGAISFYGTEWMGLNVDGYLNVVEATKQERELNPFFPADCFVIENQGIDGLVVAADEKGRVFCIQYKTKKLVCNSISEYVDICLKRK